MVHFQSRTVEQTSFSSSELTGLVRKASIPAYVAARLKEASEYAVQQTIYGIPINSYAKMARISQATWGPSYSGML